MKNKPPLRIFFNSQRFRHLECLKREINIENVKCYSRYMAHRLAIDQIRVF